MKNNQKLIEEMEEIRVRLTQIYMVLGNPKNCPADMLLKEDIERFKKNLLTSPSATLEKPKETNYDFKVSAEKTSCKIHTKYHPDCVMCRADSKEPSPKPCPECDGTGFWYCDERGNEYKRPVKCEDCKGQGFLKSNHYCPQFFCGLTEVIK